MFMLVKSTHEQKLRHAYHEENIRYNASKYTYLKCGVSIRLCSIFLRSKPSDRSLPEMHVWREPLSFRIDACVLKGSDTDAGAPMSISFNKQTHFRHPKSLHVRPRA